MTLRSWLATPPGSALPDELPGEALFLGEAPDAVALSHWGDAPEARWTRADVFTSEWNFRFRRLGDAMRVVAAGPVPGAGTLGEPDREVSLGEAEADPKHIMLWGRRNAGEAMWIELRVPHLMTADAGLHPDGHGKEHSDQMVRRRLVVARHEGDEGSFFHRYTGLSYAKTGPDDTFLEPLSS